MSASPENQYIGDLMVLSVLADSSCVNDQEREVLLRWIELSQQPGVAWEAVGGFRFDAHAGWQQVATEYASDPDVTTLYRKPATPSA